MKKALILSYFALVAVVLFTPQLGKSEPQDRVVIRSVDTGDQRIVFRNGEVVSIPADWFDFRHDRRWRDRSFRLNSGRGIENLRELRNLRELGRLERLGELRHLGELRRLDRLDRLHDLRLERLERLNDLRFDRLNRLGRLNRLNRLDRVWREEF